MHAAGRIEEASPASISIPPVGHKVEHAFSILLCFSLQRGCFPHGLLTLLAYILGEGGGVEPPKLEMTLLPLAFMSSIEFSRLVKICLQELHVISTWFPSQRRLCCHMQVALFNIFCKPNRFDPRSPGLPLLTGSTP